MWRVNSSGNQVLRGVWHTKRDNVLYVIAHKKDVLSVIVLISTYLEKDMQIII